MLESHYGLQILITMMTIPFFPHSTELDKESQSRHRELAVTLSSQWREQQTAARAQRSSCDTQPSTPVVITSSCREKKDCQGRGLAPALGKDDSDLLGHQRIGREVSEPVPWQEHGYQEQRYTSSQNGEGCSCSWGREPQRQRALQH